MYLDKCVLLILSCLSLTGVLGGVVPDYIRVCHRNDPQVEQCILNSIETLRPLLKDGLPELDVPPAEPLVLSMVKVSDPSSGFSAFGKNIKVYGATNFQVTNLKLETATDTRLTVHLGLIIPRLEFEGDYEVAAKILSLPINANGRIRANATETKADMVIHGIVRKKGNHNYLRFTKMDMALNIDDYSVRFDNLFNDKALEEATNQLVNQNRKELMKSINPIITRNAIENILSIANKIAKNQPYDLLFPA